MALRIARLRPARAMLSPVALAAGLLFGADAGALPTGATVVSGQVQVGSPAGGELLIRQSSASAAIDWRSFSIDAGERVRVQQPGSSAVLYSAVRGDDPSLIFGQLLANGRVFLSNPRGILFGAGSQVDVGGLVATTLRLNGHAPAAGGRLSLVADAQAGSLRVDGSIRASGTVALVAPAVEVRGTVEAGRVGLAAVGAVDVDLDGDGLVFFQARDAGLDGRLALAGRVQANAGLAELQAAARSGVAGAVLNLDGVVQARGLAQQGGRIVIDGGEAGRTRVAGTLDASSAVAGQRGGDIVVQGATVLLDAGARLTADGPAGGGQVRAGGGWQGRDAALRNAQDLTMRDGALIQASATERGDGGTVVLWSQGTTVFDGRITARGAGPGGAGGRVETSGHLTLGVSTGQVDAGAGAGGARGLWLLDPSTLEISDTAPAGTSYNDALTADGSTAVSIRPSVLATASNAGGGTDIALTASGNITVSSDVALTGTNAGFSLSNAGGAGSIAINANISTTNGDIALSSGTGGISMLASKTLNAGTATIALDGGGGPVNLASTAGGAAVAAGTGLVSSNTGAAAIGITNASTLVLNNLRTGLGGTITLQHSGAATQAAGSIILEGALDKQGAGTLSLNAGNSFHGATTLGQGVVSIASDSALGAAPATATPGHLLLNGGTLQVTADMTLGDRRGIALDSAGGSIDVAATRTLSYSGIVADGGFPGLLTKSGAGTLVLTGSNTFSGGAVVVDGTVASGASGLGSGNLTLGDATHTGTLKALANLSSNLNVDVAAGGGVFDSNGFAVTHTGLLSGSGDVTKTGAGSLSLAGGNTYTGRTTVSGGTLVIAADDALGVAPGVPTASHLVLSGGTLQTSASFTLDANRGVALGDGAIGVSGGAVSVGGGAVLTVAGSIADNGSSTGTLDKGGAGTLVLSAVNTHTGATTVGAGTLSIAADSALGAAPPNVTPGHLVLDGGTLRLTGSPVLDSRRGIALGNGSSGSSGGSIEVSAGNIVSYAGIVADNGSSTGTLDKHGDGTLVLTGANAYSGRTTVAAGLLAVNASGLGSGPLTLGDATHNGTLQATAVLNLTQAVTLAAGGGTVDSNGRVLTLSGNLDGSGGLTKTGSSALTLSGSNTYTGGTTVGSGTLSLAGGAALADSGPVTVAATATLNVAASEAIDGLSGSGALTLAAGQALTVGAGNASSSFSGAVSGAGSLVKSGTGTLTLSGSNSHSGGTTVAAGTLAAGSGALGSGTLTLGDATHGGILQAGAAMSLTQAVALAAGGGTVDSNGHDITLSGSVAGSGGLTKAGSGMLTLSGGNAYTGATTVSAGTLRLSGGAAIADSAAVAVSPGATLALAADETIDALSGGGAITLASLQTLTVGAGNTSSTFSGTVSGAGALVKSGTGTLTLSGSNSHTGSTTVATGTLVAGSSALGSGALTLGDATHSGTLQAGGALSLTQPVTLAAGGGVVNSNGQTVTVSGSVGGSGALTKTGSGTLALSGSNTYTGATTVSAGTLSLSGGAAIADTASVSVAGGATLALAASETLDGLAGNGTVTMASGQTLTAGAGNASSSFSGVLSGAGSLVKTGSGTLGLSGSNSFSGGVTVSAGTLSLSGGAAVADAASVSVASGATLAVAASETVDGLSGGGTVSLAALQTLTVGAGNASSTFSGLLTGAGNLAKSGTGTLTLDGSSGYTGTTTVAAGTLAAGSAHLGSGALTLGDATHSGTLQATSAISLTQAVTLAAGGGVVDTNGQTVNLSGSVAGSGALTKTGIGTLILGGSNTFTGTTTVSDGSLNLAGGAAIADTASVSVISGATLALTASETIDGLAGGGAVTLDSGQTLTAGAGNASSSFSGTLSGAGALAKSGSGTLALSGSNTYTGSTTVAAGTLAVGGSSLGSGALTLGDATHNGTLQAAAALSLAQAVTLAAGGGTLNSNGQTVSISGQVSGSGALTKSGSGTLALSGSNSFTGTATVNAGTLSLAGGAAIADAASISVATGATLALTASETLDGLSGSGAVTLAPGQTLTVGAGNGGGSFSGALSGAGSLVKTGTGTITLSGSNSHTGGTTVAAGTLAVGSGALGSGALTLGDATRAGTLQAVADLSAAQAVTLAAGGGVLDSNGHSLTLAGSVDGAGALTKSGAGTLGLSGSNSFTGTTTVNAGTLRLAGGSALADSASVVLANAAGVQLALDASETLGTLSGGGPAGGTLALGSARLTLGTASDSRFAGAISGSAAAGTVQLVKQGSGTWTLAGIASLSGATQVSAGSLAIDSGGQLGGRIEVAAAATLSTATGHADALADSASLTVAGTLALGGHETLASLALNGGTLTGGGGASLAATTLTSAGLSTLLTTVTASSGATVSDGTLSVASGARLSTPAVAGGGGTPVVRVAAGASLATAAGVIDGLGDASTLDVAGTLRLGGSETLAGLRLNGGSVVSATGAAGRLSTTATTLSGGLVGLPLDTLTLASGGSSSLAGAVTVSGTATVTDGTLSLASGGQLLGRTTIDAGATLATSAAGQLGAASTLQVAGTLQLAASEGLAALTLASGTVASSGGGGRITAVSLDSTGASTLSLPLELSGTATVSAGTLNLTSGASLTGSISVQGGATLATQGAGQLGAASSLSVAGRLDLAGAESVASLALDGGSLGRTTAAGALATGVLTSDGGSRIGLPVSTGRSEVLGGTLILASGGTLDGPVSVRSGATLRSTAADQLGDAMALGVAGTLNLGGNDTVASLTLDAGTLASDTGATLRGTQATLNAGSVQSPLAVQTLASHGASGVAAPVSAATSITVADGSLTVSSGGRLGAPLISVAAGAQLGMGAGLSNTLDSASALTVAGTLALGGSEAVDRLALEGGTLTQGRSATGHLGVSSATTLNAGTVSAALDTATLDSQGASTLRAAVTASGGASVSGGTLTIASGGRLGTPGGDGSAGAPAVRVAGGATLVTASGVSDGLGDASAVVVTGTLDLGAAETIDRLVLNGGTLTSAAGAATRLTATTAASLDSGSVHAALTTAALDSSGSSRLRAAVAVGGTARIDGGSLTLDGSGASLSAGLIQVQAGTLQTGSTAQLAPGSAVAVAAGAQLDVGAAEQVASLSLSGILSGSGSLRAGTTTLDGGTLSAPLSTTGLTSHGSSTVTAAVQATGQAVVADGRLTLASGGSLASPQLQLQPGAVLTTQASGQIGSAAAVQVASGATLMLAGAERVASLDLAGTLASAAASAAQGQAARHAAAAAPTGPVQAAAATGGSLDVAGLTTLSGASVQAPLVTQTLVAQGSNQIAAAVQATASADIAGGLTRLDSGGSLGTPLLGVQAGVLQTTADAQLAGTAALSVAAGARLSLGGSERVDTLALAGTLDAGLAGSGRLGVAGAALADGRVAAPLDAATLVSDGASGIDADVSATTSAQVRSGTLTLAGTLAAPAVTVAGGASLLTTAAERLASNTQLRLADGATVVLGGSQTLGQLADDGVNAANGTAELQIGSFRLATGSLGGDASFAGRISGSGTLDKQGSGQWTLTGANAHGDTVVTAGVLRIGDGGSRGQLGSGGVLNAATLRFDRADDMRVDNAIRGSGVVEQAGNGVLTLGSSGNAWAGATRVLAGTLRTAGAERLPDATELSVGAGARLVLAGDETLQSLSADGPVQLGGSVSTAGAQRYGAAVTVAAGAAVTLAAPGAAITATDAGNDWGSEPLSITAAQVQLSAGQGAGGAWRDLTLGALRLGAGAGDSSRIEAGRVLLGASTTATGDARRDGLLQLDAGTLSLVAHAVPVYTAAEDSRTVDPLGGKHAIQVASDAIAQGAASQAVVADGALLSLQTDAGSISLSSTGNRFSGGIEALAGTAWGQAWALNPLTLDGVDIARQQRISVSGLNLNVGGRGLDADLVRLTAATLATGVSAVIRARLWYNDSAFGTQLSTPGLRLNLLPEAYTAASAFGDTDHLINVDVGSTRSAAREGLSAGFVQVLPKAGARGATAVYLAGLPVAQGQYSFFHDGAGQASEVPVLYNRVLPATPQLTGSLSAVASVSETARRERFEDAVRTESVVQRLRAGIIVEVGPGQPATAQQGLAQPVSGPAQCVSAGANLQCEGDDAQRGDKVDGRLRKGVIVEVGPAASATTGAAPAAPPPASPSAEPKR